MDWKPHVTVAAVIERDGKFLLVDENAEHRQVYNQPAGHLEDGESLLDAVIRETLEETTCHFTPRAIIGIYLWRNPLNRETFMRIGFWGSASEPDSRLTLDAGIAGNVWMSRDDLAAQPERLRSPLVLQVIDDYLAGRRYPLEMLQNLPEGR